MSTQVTNKVHELRTNARVTQEELARQVGVTRQTIIAIEKGNYIPSLLLAVQLARFFKTTVESIFSIE